MILPQNNPHEPANAESSSRLIYQLGSKEHVEGHQNPHAAAKSIDIYLNLTAPGASKTIETYVAAFGENYAKVEQISDEAVVLRLYPGGARELKQ